MPCHADIITHRLYQTEMCFLLDLLFSRLVKNLRFTYRANNPLLVFRFLSQFFQFPLISTGRTRPQSCSPVLDSIMLSTIRLLFDPPEDILWQFWHSGHEFSYPLPAVMLRTFSQVRCRIPFFFNNQVINGIAPTSFFDLTIWIQHGPDQVFIFL